MSNEAQAARDKTIRELAAKGVTFRQIAAEFHISFQRVHQIVQAAIGGK